MAYYYPEHKFITEYAASCRAGEYESLDHFADSVWDWLLKNCTSTYVWQGTSTETRDNITTYFVYVRILDEQMATLFLLRWS